MRYVIDAGFCKLKVYNPKIGMDALQVREVVSRWMIVAVRKSAVSLYVQLKLQRLRFLCCSKRC